MAVISRSGALYRNLRLARNRVVAFSKGLNAVHATASVHRTVTAARDLVAGPFAYVGPSCSIAPMTRIGAYAMLAPRVAVVGGDHVWDVVGTPTQFSGRPEQLQTVIGRDAWIGFGAIISRGVTIGEGAIVGAGSVVTKDVPEYEVWAGVPARKLRDRFDVEDRERHRQALDAGQASPNFAAPQGAGRP
jgi:acetyltransferase-like isoleucine patch superfamily enzyme